LAISKQNNPPVSAEEESTGGTLIINADDWGRDVQTTDRILECAMLGSVSSASAMVFMQDSERAAELAREQGVDVGLHLNFTTSFSAEGCSPRLAEQQQRLQRYLLQNRLAQIFFHPGLAASFEYVIAAQIEEFRRLYGVEPERIDGHHHMHLCANVVFGELLPAGTLVRRNFSFSAREKSWINRFYRSSIDKRLKRRHQLVDYLFPLAPVEPLDRLDRVFGLARTAIVEVETHPINQDEYRFLTHGVLFTRIGSHSIASRFNVSGQVHDHES
jgi:hypothetical protein